MPRKSIVDQKSERDVDNTDDNLKEVSDSESEQSSSDVEIDVEAQDDSDVEAEDDEIITSTDDPELAEAKPSHSENRKGSLNPCSTSNLALNRSLGEMNNTGLDKIDEPEANQTGGSFSQFGRSSKTRLNPLNVSCLVDNSSLYPMSNTNANTMNPTIKADLVGSVSNHSEFQGGKNFNCSNTSILAPSRSLGLLKSSNLDAANKTDHAGPEAEMMALPNKQNLNTSVFSNLASKKSLSSTKNPNLAAKANLSPLVGSDFPFRSSLGNAKKSSLTSIQSLPSSNSLAFFQNMPSRKRAPSKRRHKSASRITSAKSIAARKGKKLSKKRKPTPRSKLYSRCGSMPEITADDDLGCCYDSSNRPVFDVLHQFGAEINKSLNSKRRKVEKFTQQCEASRQKVDDMLQNQKNKRALLYDEFNKAVELLMGHWDQDLQKINCTEEKLNMMWNQQAKMYHSAKAAQKERYKSIRDLHLEFLDSLAAMEACHNHQQELAAKTSSKELYDLKKQLMNDLNNRECTTVRRSLRNILQQQ